jgi:hypothetical protein
MLDVLRTVRPSLRRMSGQKVKISLTDHGFLFEKIGPNNPV